ncbi:unnamed protein product [Caenorhabditis brenneri]
MTDQPIKVNVLFEFTSSDLIGSITDLEALKKFPLAFNACGSNYEPKIVLPMFCGPKTGIFILEALPELIDPKNMEPNNRPAYFEKMVSMPFNEIMDIAIAADFHLSDLLMANASAAMREKAALMNMEIYQVHNAWILVGEPTIRLPEDCRFPPRSISTVN